MQNDYTNFRLSERVTYKGPGRRKATGVIVAITYGDPRLFDVVLDNRGEQIFYARPEHLMKEV